jgi:hypothetical protein
VADETQVEQLLRARKLMCAAMLVIAAKHQNRSMIICSIAARPSSYKKHGKQCERRRLLSDAFHQIAKVHFITKLTLDYSKRMFNLSPDLRLGVFDLASNMTDQSVRWLTCATGASISGSFLSCMAYPVK